MESPQIENPKFQIEKEELITMYEEDFSYILKDAHLRHELKEQPDALKEARALWWNEYVESRKSNVAKLKEIIAEIGWPTISKVGEEACFSAFMIIQHADFDLDFQKQGLEMMEQARNDIHLFGMAALTDRVAMNSGKDQTYGTQLKRDEDGAVVPLVPIKDPENVEKRRAEMGLMPFEIYKSRFGGNLSPENESYVEKIGRFQKVF